VERFAVRHLPLSEQIYPFKALAPFRVHTTQFCPKSRFNKSKCSYFVWGIGGVYNGSYEYVSLVVGEFAAICQISSTMVGGQIGFI
jgi:hypothetical protein